MSCNLHAFYTKRVEWNILCTACMAQNQNSEKPLVQFLGKQKYHSLQKNDSPPLSIALCRSFVCGLAPAQHSVLKNVTEAAIIGHGDTFLVCTFLFFSFALKTLPSWIVHSPVVRCLWPGPAARNKNGLAVLPFGKPRGITQAVHSSEMMSFNCKCRLMLVFYCGRQVHCGLFLDINCAQTSALITPVKAETANEHVLSSYDLLQVSKNATKRGESKWVGRGWCMGGLVINCHETDCT